MSVSDINKRQKPCPYCDKKPACPGYTCKRIAGVTLWPDGTVVLDFVPDKPYAVEVTHLLSKDAEPEADE